MLREGLDGACVVENEDEVGQLESDLAAEATAGSDNGRGRGPATVRETGDDKAGTEARGAEKAGFEDCKDRKALATVLG